MKHLAFDLDDTLVDTGATILRLIEEIGFPVADYREPYNSLRSLMNENVISPEDYDLLLATAADQAQPMVQTVNLLKQTIRDHGAGHIVSTRAHMNPTETLNALGKILSPDEIFQVQIHWSKAPSETIRKAVEDQGLGDAKVYHFHELVKIGITHFIDDLGFNIAAIIESVPGLTPVWLLQPWTIDRLYKSEYMDHPSVEFLALS